MSVIDDDVKPKTAVARLPLPTHLDPPTSKRNLMSRVRDYFHVLYNNPKDDTFREWLVAVNNKSAITENLWFDRGYAVRAIRDLAKKSEDATVEAASEGAIYKSMTRVMREHQIGLKLRRQQLKKLLNQS